MGLVIYRQMHLICYTSIIIIVTQLRHLWLGIGWSMGGKRSSAYLCHFCCILLGQLLHPCCSLALAVLLSTSILLLLCYWLTLSLSVS